MSSNRSYLVLVLCPLLFSLMAFHTGKGSAALCLTLSACLLWCFFGLGWRPVATSGDLLMKLGLTVWIHPKLPSSQRSLNQPNHGRIIQHNNKKRFLCQLSISKYNILNKQMIYNWLRLKLCEIQPFVHHYSTAFRVQIKLSLGNIWKLNLQTITKTLHYYTINISLRCLFFIHCTKQLQHNATPVCDFR